MTSPPERLLGFMREIEAEQDFVEMMGWEGPEQFLIWATNHPDEYEAKMDELKAAVDTRRDKA